MPFALHTHSNEVLCGNGKECSAIKTQFSPLNVTCDPEKFTTWETVSTCGCPEHEWLWVLGGTPYGKVQPFLKPLPHALAEALLKYSRLGIFHHVLWSTMFLGFAWLLELSCLLSHTLQCPGTKCRKLCLIRKEIYMFSVTNILSETNWNVANIITSIPRLYIQLFLLFGLCCSNNIMKSLNHVGVN